RKARIGMQRGIVLDLRALAELDPFVVAAQHRSEPHTRVGLEPHAPDDRCALRNPVALGKIGALSVELKNGHARAPSRWLATLPRRGSIGERGDSALIQSS